MLHKTSSQSAGENRANLIPPGLATPFRRAATALMLGSTIALSGLPANAQDAPVQRAVVTADSAPVEVTPVSIRTDDIEILPDSLGRADAWVAGNGERVAVSVRLGSRNGEQMKSDIPEIVGYQLSIRGEKDVVYFWSLAEGTGTGFVIHSDAYVTSPLSFGDPKNIVAEIEKMVRIKNGKAQDYITAAYPSSFD